MLVYLDFFFGILCTIDDRGGWQGDTQSDHRQLDLHYRRCLFFLTTNVTIGDMIPTGEPTREFGVTVELFCHQLIMKITMQGLHTTPPSRCLKAPSLDTTTWSRRKKKQVDEDGFTLVRSKWGGNLRRAELTPRWYM